MSEAWKVVKRRGNHEEFHSTYHNRSQACVEAERLAFRDAGMRHGKTYHDVIFTPDRRSIVIEFEERDAPSFTPVEHYGVFEIIRGAPRLKHSYLVRRLIIHE